MRTTVTIDDDVLDRAREISKRSGRPFRQVINEALRHGLSVAEQPFRSRDYHTEARPLHRRAGYSLDNIQELLSEIDGEQSR